MSTVIMRLDCGCFVMSDGKREWCGKCGLGNRQEEEKRLEEAKVATLRNDIRKDVRSLETEGAELLRHIRSVKLRGPDEYRANVAERERLEGLLDALIDYLAEEDRLDEEDGDGR